MNNKPTGGKNYGSIPHLPASRMGPGDHACHEGQAKIATAKTRDRHDEVIVQEKLDGSNVGVFRSGHVLYPLSRSGWPARTSPHKMHRLFDVWVANNFERFMDVLEDGQRIVGEWMIQAHGTVYSLPHEPFVAFDLMVGTSRMPYDEMIDRIDGHFVTPTVLHRGGAFSIENAVKALGQYGYHGASEPVEGAVWRIERDVLRGSGRVREVDFLVKYVRPDKIDGIYLKEPKPIWNAWPAGTGPTIKDS